MLIVAFFIFWIGAIGVRLVHLQVNQHDSFRKKALGQRRDVVKSKMLRGTIFDRNGRPLAMSMKVDSLYADPSEIADVDYAARKIANVLNVSRKAIAKRIRDGKENRKRFVWIARKLEKEKVEEVNAKLEKQELRKFDLPRFEGLHWTKEQKRSYPYQKMAAHVIGFSNADDVGQAGIELSQESALRGETTRTVRERDRLGRVYDEWGAKRDAPKDVVLTLSNSIQYKVEEALARGAQRARAKSGKAVVLDPKTGEILAMANYPSFDPNKFRKLKPGMWRNRVIQDNYSPGSVFKLVTYGAALEEKIISPEEKVNCGNGTITIARHTFNDSHAVGNVTYTRAFAESSNVGAIKTGLKVGKRTFYDYARDFGFGSKTGIGLPAEATGMLRDPKSWNGDSLASMSIGYEIGVTALQSATAFATIANNGVKVQPHIIKEIRKSDGEIVHSAAPEKVEVVSAETARDLRKMLREVVVDGTARRAQLKGYTSAGKTGTAWKYDAALKAINRNKYVSSFIGFAPADDPKIVIAVVMDEPRGAFRYGGQVAAPVFREIAEQVLPELNVMPDLVFPEEPVVEEAKKEVERKQSAPPSDKKSEEEKKSRDLKKQSDAIKARKVKPAKNSSNDVIKKRKNNEPKKRPREKSKDDKKRTTKARSNVGKKGKT